MRQIGSLALLSLGFATCFAQHGQERCTIRELSIRAGDANAAGGGTIQFTYTLTNISSRTCFVSGYPSATALDAKGRVIAKVEFFHAGSSIRDSEDQPARMMVLKPGARAWFMIDGNDGTGAMDLRPCQTVTGIRIAPPGSNLSFGKTFPFSTCIGSNTPHIYYLVAGVPQ